MKKAIVIAVLIVFLGVFVMPAARAEASDVGEGILVGAVIGAAIGVVVWAIWSLGKSSHRAEVSDKQEQLSMDTDTGHDRTRDLPSAGVKEDKPRAVPVYALSLKF